MKRIFAIAVAVSFLGFLDAAHGQDQQEQPAVDPPAKAPIKLPESESAAIFTMEYSGGLRLPTPKGWTQPPYLQVFADGRVVNGANSPEGKAHEFQLKPEQLQDFLKQVVDGNEFYKIDSDTITEAVKKAGGPMIADATTLEVTVELPRGSHEVRVYAAGSAARDLPKVKSLQQLVKVEKLGRNLVLAAIAGGYEKIDRALLKVNKQLKEKGLDPMTIKELYTCKQQDGTLTINFNRKYYNDDGRWRNWVNAKFTAKGDDENVEVKTNIIKDKAQQATKAAKPDKE